MIGIAGTLGNMQKVAQNTQKKIDKKKEQFKDRLQGNSVHNQTVSDLETEKLPKEQVEKAIADIRRKMEEEKQKNRKRTVIIFATIIVLLVLLILLLN